MISVLISIRPKWCSMIADGRKTTELRKTKPKLEFPFKCYIYMTKGFSSYATSNNMRCHNNGGMCVIGEFVCDGMLSHCEMANADIAELTSCVRREDIRKYADGKEVFGWHISDLKIYDKPKDLSEFKPCHRCEYVEGCRDGVCRKSLRRPPQSWCYVEELEDSK